ncbi:alpha/beta fold hydrolase [Paenibacillus chartarius]|uniref:Alpha/beta fold hydrolase n=1 Tax=Paenibacillus chartarius TaxID=747481 RepID=A0ABV6DUK7_9BACL
MFLLKGATSPHKDQTGAPIPGSIAELMKVKIGGVDQWLLIRGEDLRNPVLLFVHGGPGQSNMYLSHLLDGELEKYFTIVNWDQRGAGKSVAAGKADPAAMRLEQLLQDAGEVIRYVLAKLNTEKLYVLGHSFGTILGMLITQRYPAFIRRYIGLCQSVGLQENLKASYAYIVREAERAGDSKTLRELAKIGPPPFVSFAKGLWKYSLLLQKYGGKVHSKPGGAVFRSIWTAPEYSLADRFRYIQGVMFSVKHLYRELLAHDLQKAVQKVEVPVSFFLGTYDQATPSHQAAEYLKLLDAPHKELVWFEQSAHLPQFEEPQKYVQELVRLRGIGNYS